MRRGLLRFLAPARKFCTASLPPGTSTAAIHADTLAAGISTDFDVSPPLSLSTTYEGGDHVYSRLSSPTRERAEAALAAVESTASHAAHAVLYSSGLAATFAVLSRLLPQRVAIDGGYHGTHQARGWGRKVARRG